MRDPLRRVARLVVKIGSSSLRDVDAAARALGEDVAALQKKGAEVIVVSSGAIALGAKKLRYAGRPRELPKLQAAAAAGQSLLMRAYEDAFREHGLLVAQVLLTHGDIASRERARNAERAIAELLDRGAVPILNENDTVAVEEIKFGDNDELAALVTALLQADLLVLLSDVAGLLDRDGNVLERATTIAEARALVRTSKSREGTGGMASKLRAFERAHAVGAHGVIADAREPRVLTRLLEGEPIGTWFPGGGRKVGSRLAWLLVAGDARGDLVLDAGAIEALLRGRSSVLAVGVLGVRGRFERGDLVNLLGPDGAVLGRGVVREGALAIIELAGRKVRSIPGASSPVLVHRNELSLV